MQFQHSYYHTLDRGYYVPPDMAEPKDLQIAPDPKRVQTKLGPEEIGFGSNPFQQPIQAVNARIKEGVGYIDIPFFGAGKGNKERYTPESISSKERTDIRELAEINEVKLSTHASTNIHGLAGYGREGFDEHAREETLKEIKKAIDFASDLQGGAVVFHTGEFPRPFSEQKWNKGDFVHYPEEERMAVLHMVDDRSGRVIGEVRKSEDVYEPKYKRAERDYEDDKGHGVKKGDWIDMEDNYLNPHKTEDLLRRVPEWDDVHEQFVTNRLTWKDFEERASKSQRTPEEEYLLSRWTEQLTRARGGSLYYSQRYEADVRRRDAIKKALEFYRQLEDTMPKEEQWKIMVKDPTIRRFFGEGLLHAEDKLPSDVLKQELTEAERALKFVHEASASHDVEAKMIQDRLDHMRPIADYGMMRTADTIARAAEMAWKNTEHKKTKRPIYVSPESWLPSMYGSHPDEMSTIIDSSREDFKKMLKSKYKMPEKKAEEVAKKHIKGTLDVGHFNMWRQYFQAKPGESPQQTDKRFNKWYLKEVEKLVKGGKIGQVHITDNMGFDDEHLTPGQGNVPMQEVLNIVEESGIKDIVVEAGSFNPQKIIPETFEYFGSPVYNAGMGPMAGASFAQFHEQHFGYHAPPFYIVGAYSPSNDWKLWSEVQLE